MTVDETAKILSVIRASYPNFYKGTPKEDTEALVCLWTEMFTDVPYSLVGAAVKTYIATDTTGFPPNIGKLNKIMYDLLSGEKMTALEAIQPIIKATKNGQQHSEEEFEKLSPILQRLVGSPSQLRAWANTGEAEFNTVVVSQLIRAYNDAVNRDSVVKAIPESVRAVIEAQTKQIEDKEGMK